jgi:4-hydroxy-3-methylbut-2-enyl diphosphate reductase
MRVIRAEAMGMCFGVRDALELVAGLEAPAAATIYGELVHNEQVVDGLRRRGFRQSLPEAALPETDTVVITAHGISDRERSRLRAAGKTLVDTTCPLVRRVHEAAQELQREGCLVIILGQRQHVEVVGIVGDLNAYEVVQSEDDVACYPSQRLGVVCQSTTRPATAERLLAAIRERNPGKEIRFVDTICRPTRERQLAAKKLLDDVEALVVVGGKHSNNTRQLAEMASARGLPVAHVQSAADLDAKWARRFRVVGLTAGTSTLDSTIDAVQRRLEQINS